MLRCLQERQQLVNMLLWVGFVLILFYLFHDKPFFLECALILMIGTQPVSTSMSSAILLTYFILGLLLLGRFHGGEEDDDEEDDDPEPEDPEDPPRFGVALSLGMGPSPARSRARSGFSASRSSIAHRCCFKTFAA